MVGHPLAIGQTMQPLAIGMRNGTGKTLAIGKENGKMMAGRTGGRMIGGIDGPLEIGMAGKRDGVAGKRDGPLEIGMMAGRMAGGVTSHGEARMTGGVMTGRSKPLEIGM